MKHTSLLFTIGALLLSVALGTGCRKKVPYTAAEPQSQATQRPDSQVPASKDSCHVLEGFYDDPRNQPSVREISILKPQTAVANLVSLTVGKEYSVTSTCYDSGGKQIHKTSKPHVFTATGAEYTTWAPFTPDYKIHAAGKWTWVMEVSGIGKLRTEIRVLPPTPDEMANLARYEKARENVLRAFSHYWVGTDGTFHTVISRETKVTDEEKNRMSRLVELKRREQWLATRPSVIGQSRRSRRDTDAKEQWNEWTDELAMVRNDIKTLEELAVIQRPSDSHLGYIEVAGMEWLMTKGGTSEADKLNGVNYRGSLDVTFRVFRYYRNEGWTDWRDCNHLPFMLGALFGGVPSELESRLNLSFSIMERDKNWFVTTSTGDEFANGNLTKADSYWKNEAPLESYARALKNSAKSFTRESYRTMGEDARNNPAAVEQSAIATMNMIRGKELIR